jgi:RNA polymerase-interacting CarD/CdnL/TRCF family regulator
MVMPASNATLQPGDPIFHPQYGFGTIHSLTRRDPAHPITEARSTDDGHGQTQEYYEIQLLEGGSLLVPVSRADSVGLRRLTNGMAAIRQCLNTPAQSLPNSHRERAAALRARSQEAGKASLAHTVRDMLVQSRGRTLSAGERTWLDKSCELLSIEVALVDGISKSQARAAIWEAVKQLSNGEAIVEQK